MQRRTDAPRTAWLLVAALLTMGAIGGCGASSLGDDSSRLPGANFRAEVAEEVNAVRADNGLSALSLAAIGSPDASGYAEEIAQQDSSEHSELAREAIAIVFANWRPMDKHVVALWMASPPHRAILLDSDATTVDVGCAIGWHRDGPATVESAFVVLRVQ